MMCALCVIYPKNCLFSFLSCNTGTEETLLKTLPRDGEWLGKGEWSPLEDRFSVPRFGYRQIKLRMAWGIDTPHSDPPPSRGRKYFSEVPNGH